MMCASQQGVRVKKPKGCIPCLIGGECCCDCERVYACGTSCSGQQCDTAAGAAAWARRTVGVDFLSSRR